MAEQRRLFFFLEEAKRRVSLSNDAILGARVLAYINLQQGDVSSAINHWVQIRDINSLLKFANIDVNKDEICTSQSQEALWGADKGTLPLAHCLIQEKNFKQSEMVLKQAMEEFPYSVLQQEWLRKLGYIYTKTERWNEAKTIYTEMVQKKPYDYYAHTALGKTLYEQFLIK